MSRKIKAVLALALMALLFALSTGTAMAVNVSSYTELITALDDDNSEAISVTGDIELEAGLTLGEKLTIAGNVTINGNGHTITRADNYTGTLFSVNAGASLTLDGGLIIDGGNNWAMDMDLYNKDLYAMISIPATDAEKYFTPESSAPVASAYMITLTKGNSNEAPGGKLTLNDVTIQNNYSIKSGIISAAPYTTTVLNGAKITHVACTQSSGVVVNASGAGIEVIMNKGTVIDGNHVGSNHGIFKIYSGTVFTMNGGEIKNTTGWDSNGTAVGIYNATFIMNGGTIRSNSSIYGPNNGRNASIYLHSNSVFNMYDGSICSNVGRSRGGIDSSKSTSTLNIYGGEVLNNESLIGNSTVDVGGTTGTWNISGGTFTQDVSQWVDPQSGLCSYPNGNGTYTLEPASKVHAVDFIIFPDTATLTVTDANGYVLKSGTGSQYNLLEGRYRYTVYIDNNAFVSEVFDVMSDMSFTIDATLDSTGVAPAPTDSLPQTGDNSSLLLWGALLAMTGAALCLMMKKSRA